MGLKKENVWLYEGIYLSSVQRHDNPSVGVYWINDICGEGRDAKIVDSQFVVVIYKSVYK